MRRGRDTGGYSLVEVMAATVILAIGVSASVAAMNTALNTTRQSQNSGSLASIAQAEMERQRSLTLPVSVAEFSQGGVTRSVEVTGCNFAGTVLSCTPATNCTDTNPACSIVVTVSADGTTERLEIETIKALVR